MNPSLNIPLHVIGIEQARNIERKYNEDGSTREVIPGVTRYFLRLQAPTGEFLAEVSRDVWKAHVQPACGAGLRAAPPKEEP